MNQEVADRSSGTTEQMALSSARLTDEAILVMPAIGATQGTENSHLGSVERVASRVASLSPSVKMTYSPRPVTGRGPQLRDFRGHESGVVRMLPLVAVRVPKQIGSVGIVFAVARPVIDLHVFIRAEHGRQPFDEVETGRGIMITRHPDDIHRGDFQEPLNCILERLPCDSENLAHAVVGRFDSRTLGGLAAVIVGVQEVPADGQHNAIYRKRIGPNDHRVNGQFVLPLRDVQ